MEAPHPLIAAALAAPKTHLVATVYADGKRNLFETRSAGTAEIFAQRENHKIGRDLIDRMTGNMVRVTAVLIVSKEELAADYVKAIGYNPFDDDAAATLSEVYEILREWEAESGQYIADLKA